MELKEYLQIMVNAEASDLYLTTGAPPYIKVSGHLQKIPDDILTPGKVKNIAHSLLSEEQIDTFQSKFELNIGLSMPGIGRFRVNMFVQRNEVAMVFRHNKTKIPSIESLALPLILKNLILKKRGLILIVGATSSGKSTTLASMIEYRNANLDGHIITIEDPIEFLHDHNKSIVSQREIGIDTLNYEEALKNTLRQAPDVILIGEIRTRETMEYSITFAETGHLCLSTLHASNVEQALDRIIHFFPHDRQPQLLLDLSFNMVAIISQRLIPAFNGKLIVAVEVMLATPLICDLIRRGELGSIREVMEKGENIGMKTFDSALYDLYSTGKISVEEALANADSANNLRLKISLKESIKPQANIQENDLSLQDERIQDSGIMYPNDSITRNK